MDKSTSCTKKNLSCLYFCHLYGQTYVIHCKKPHKDNVDVSLPTKMDKNTLYVPLKKMFCLYFYFMGKHMTLRQVCD